MRAEGATRANGERTKVKIMDAAETFFGARGFDSVSLRDITVEAGVTLALASYHFKTKERLFEAVVERRADVLCAARRERLASLENPQIRDILDAFMAPLFEQLKSADKGWESYVRVLARLGEDERWLELLSTHFDGVVHEFMAALRAVEPDADPEWLARSFIMTLQLMLLTVSRQKRLDRVTEGSVSSGNLNAAYEGLLDYATAGVTSRLRR